MDTKKDIKKCVSDLISQGHSRDDAKRMCSGKESSKQSEHSSFSEEEYSEKEKEQLEGSPTGVYPVEAVDEDCYRSGVGGLFGIQSPINSLR